MAALLGLRSTAFSPRGQRGSFFLAGVSVDITQRKLAEEALRDARADVERMARLTTMGELTRVDRS